MSNIHRTCFDIAEAYAASWNYIAGANRQLQGRGSSQNALGLILTEGRP